MSTIVKFLILYLIPILSIAGTFGTYMLAYGTSGEGLVSFAFIIALVGLVASCYITITLVSQFLVNKTVYLGVIFSILACLLEFIAFAFFIVMFKEALRFSF